jgi:CheY-like chemotaxis protein
MPDDSEQQQFIRKHILVINSSPDFLDALRVLLQDAQFNVTTTNHVPQTCAMIAAGQPDLLIVDLAVGQQAGWDLLEQVQQDAAARDIPMIVTSTSEKFLDRASAQSKRLGGHTYLLKPFAVDTLLQMVHGLVGQA